MQITQASSGHEQPFLHNKYEKIPKDWDIVTIKEIADVKSGKRLPLGEKLTDKKTQHPYIRIIDFENNSVKVNNLMYLTEETYMKIRRYTISSNDVYISIAGTIGVTGIIPEELDNANLTENAAKLCNLKNIEKGFLSYFLNSPMLQDQIKSFIGTTTQPKLALFRIEKLRILLPPLPEQQKISSILSKVDELVQKTDQVIEQTQRLKKGLMQRLLTKGIGHIKFRSSPLGSIPDSWEIVRLGDITTISTGSTPSTFVQEYYDGGIPFIRTAEIVNKIITDAMLHVSKRAVNECSMNIYPPKTVFLAMYGQGKTRGQSALLDIYATTSQNTAAIVVNEDKLDAVYLWQYLLFSYNRLRGEGNIGYISHLNLNFVKKFSIQLPPVIEQKMIVLILSQMDNKIEKAIQIRKKIYHLKKGLMQKLLTGKIRVKV